mgnify:CR=1 FL=1
MLLLLVTVLISCSRPDSSEISLDLVESEFEVIDSVKVPYLGYFYLSDISNDGKLFLAYDAQRQEVVLFNRSGEIVNQFSKMGDVPDAHGYLRALPAFDQDNHILIHALKGTLLYKQSGEFIRKLLDPVESFGGVFVYVNGGKPLLVQHDQKNYIIIRYNGDRVHDANGKPIYEQTPLVEIYELSDPENKQQILIPSSSVFTDGLIYWETDYWPIFSLLENKLYVTMGMDPNIYVYTLSDNFELIQEEKILLPYDIFNTRQGDNPKEYSPGMAMARFSTATTVGMVKWNNYLLMEYYPGMTKQEDQELQLYYKEDREKASILSKQLREKYRRKLLLWDPENKQVIKSITLPHDIRKGFVVHNNELWYLREQSAEVEEDEFTLYQVKID